MSDIIEEDVIDHYSVSAVILQQTSKHPWGEDIWSLAGVVPGLTSEELSALEQEGTVHLLPDLSLKLFPLHADAYYHNLMSEQAKVYLICNQDDETSSILNPLLITVDYDEAAAYMETGEQVLNAALPDNLCQWLERFVLTHYQPVQPKKRRRKQWHEGDPKR